MRPVTLKLTPSEALTVYGILSWYAAWREDKGWKSTVTRRVAAKVDRALLEATEPVK